MNWALGGLEDTAFDPTDPVSEHPALIPACAAVLDINDSVEDMLMFMHISFFRLSSTESFSGRQSGDLSIQQVHVHGNFTSRRGVLIIQTP